MKRNFQITTPMKILEAGPMMIAMRIRMIVLSSMLHPQEESPIKYIITVY